MNVKGSLAWGKTVILRGSGEEEDSGWKVKCARCLLVTEVRDLPRRKRTKTLLWDVPILAT